MWNLSSLAQKAKEAAARLESQLDGSIGLVDDSLFGTSNATQSSSMPSEAPETSRFETTLEEVHGDSNEDDDFFSSSHHENKIALHMHHSNDDTVLDVSLQALSKRPPSPVAARLDIQADEGKNFFGEEDFGDQNKDFQKLESHDHMVQKDQVDSVMDDTDRGGWDEVEDIPDDISLEQCDKDSMQVTDAQQEAECRSIPKIDVEYVTPEIGDEIESSDVEPNGSMAYENSAIPSAAVDEATMKKITPSAFIFNQSTDSKRDANAVIPESFPSKTNSHEFQEESKFGLSDKIFDDTEKNNIQNNYCVLPDENTFRVMTLSGSRTDLPSSTLPVIDESEKLQYLETISELESQLFQREQQLTSKSDQITSLTMQHESEITKLREIISETKEEAKKRVLRAKERVDEMQSRLSEAIRRADASSGDHHEQSEIIAALRAEGEQLARKQGQMEQSLRSAKSESRELAEQLEIQKEEKNAVLKKVEILENEIKMLKDDLASARKGESQCKKLEVSLVTAKEESEKQRASNLLLEQQLKELKEDNKALKREIDDSKKGAALESEREATKLRKERDDLLSNLENKLRTSEREANVREDSLRHEVSELRKRWQDAVRRAEDLNMDIQRCTAPLLRQLESTERQNRARATSWAELENKLRSDLEDQIIQMERVRKERNDLEANERRAQRKLTENENEISLLRETNEALSATIEKSRAKIKELEEERKKLKESLQMIEQQASESATKIRNDMMISVMESEERYRSQIKALEAALEEEKKNQKILLKQIDDLAENLKSVQSSKTLALGGGMWSSPENKKQLCPTTNQAAILHNTLIGIDSSDNEDGDQEDIIDEVRNGSFAAVEQLSQGLKGAKLELVALKSQLLSSEVARENLLSELAKIKHTADKVPLYEVKLSELTTELNLKDSEIQALHDDISEVRFLYRQQLDSLLEEKASVNHLQHQLEENQNHEANIEIED